MEVLFSRNLVAAMDRGDFVEFRISISCPKRVNDEFVCIVASEGLLSETDLKAYGTDEIDALEYAIHLLDVLIFEQHNEFEVLWPDKSKYVRSKTLDYRWSMPEN